MKPAMPGKVKVIYWTGIKTALSIRENTNKEIVYIESGLFLADYNSEKKTVIVLATCQNKSRK